MVKKILNKLHKSYEDPRTELQNWKTPFQFTVCVILSAQATDVGVNKITQDLFSKYQSLEDFANADHPELQKYVSSINYYKTKAQRIISAAQFILENFNGKMPSNIEDLIKIPGIGRKSANVIIHEALKGESAGVVVDTHVTRVSYRLGLQSYINQKDAVKIEQELKELFPENEWKFVSNALVLHGRYICKARKPKCSECVLNDICPKKGVTDRA